MLLIDGVKYRLWTPKDEEKEFHPLVKKNYKAIFGQESLYFDIKPRLHSKSGIGGIPDAYVINLCKPYKWYIIENELASHDVYEHIVGQVSKFMDLICELENQRELVKALCHEIEQDEELYAYVKKRVGPEIFRFMSELLSNQPKIAIVIDSITPKLDKALNTLQKLANTQVVEFKTFTRENADNILAHLFEPLHSDKGVIITNPLPKLGEVTSQPEYTMPLLESLIELGGSGKMSAVLDKVLGKMKDKLKPKDFELLTGGVIRWKNQVQWQRNNLKDEGYIKKDSPRGIWEITDEGRKYCQNQKSVK